MLRLATEADLPIMMAWRSHPLCYEGFYQQTSPLVWEGHLNWFRKRNSDWRAFVVEYDDGYETCSMLQPRPVGVVTIGQLDNWSPEVGYYIGETTLWGKGLGTQAVSEAIGWLKEYAKTHSYITGVHTTVLDRNIGSIKLIKKLGFKQGMKAREGESYWIRRL